MPAKNSPTVVVFRLTDIDRPGSMKFFSSLEKAKAAGEKMLRPGTNVEWRHHSENYSDEFEEGWEIDDEKTWLSIVRIEVQ